MRRRDLVMGPWRELATVGLVAGLGGAYAGILIMVGTVFGTMGRASGGGSLGLVMGAVAGVFILVAVYVAAVVMTNCVATVIAGRLPRIALLRLLGASARDLRRAIVRSTGTVGAIGAIAGAALGTVAAVVARTVLVRRGTLDDLDYPSWSPMLVLAVAAITVAALTAGWVGSRSVLTVTPAQAMTGTTATATATRRASRWRAVVTVVALSVGGALMAWSLQLGESGSGSGFLMAFLGSAISATGLLVGAAWVVPGLVAGVGRLLGTAPPSTIARRNAVADPLRTTRSTMGLVIGVTLVTTFAAGMAVLSASVDSWELSPGEAAVVRQILTTTTLVLIAIVVVSAVIAAVGFVSTMSLTVIQRGHEIGLLRTLGFTTGQVRSMITRESIALSATATAFGIVLGLLYGTIGAQALVGMISDGLIIAVPWSALAAIAAACVVLVLVSSRAPARRAVSVNPIEAMRIDR